MKQFTVDRFFSRDDFRFHMSRALLDHHFPEHSHEFTELFVVLSGSALHTTSSDSSMLSAGDVFVMHQPERHGFGEPKDLEIVNVMIDPKSVPIPLAYLERMPGYHALFSLEPKFRKEHGYAGRLHLGRRALDTALVKLTDMERAYADEESGYEAEVVAGYVDLAVFLAREYEADPAPSAADLIRVAGALSLLEREFRRRISLDELAREAGLSRNQFIRVFRRATGQSPIEYLLRLRTDKAAVLLKQTRETVTEIALDTGFSDGNYFARVFRRIYGVSPSTYRR